MPYKNPGDIKAARRRHYEKYRERSIRESSIRTIAQRKKLKEYVNSIKVAAGCTDCRKTFPPYVLDFDHVRGAKISNIAGMVTNGVSIARIDREIAKCEVVCANCHRIRTHGKAPDGLEPS